MLLAANLLIALCIIFAVLQGSYASSASSVNGLVLGDWGGMPIPPFHTPSQKQAAGGMDLIANQLQAKLVVALGDNFYFNGVDKPTSIRFHGTFDDVYDGDNLKHLPWHVIAGNHDNYGNVSAQIEYSKLNRRWKFPELYHSSQWTSDDKSVTVDLILIDTPGLSGTSPITDKEHPNYFDKQPLRAKEEAKDQWTWIEEKLSSSTANYIIVGGHFSVYSVCDHGSDLTLLTYLKPLLEKYNANYMSGHDHCMEHLNIPGSTVNYIVSGMGDDCCYKPSQSKSVPENSEKWSYSAKDLLKDFVADKKRDVVSGFTSFTATSASLTFTFYDQDGRPLYSTPPIAPRNIN